MSKRFNTPKEYTYKCKDGGTTVCYGKIKWDSNFSIVCEDPDFDGVAADIDGESLSFDWHKVCAYLEEKYRSDIEQITTC